MAGIQNRVIFGEGFRLQPSTAQSIVNMQEGATDASFVNHTGSPEGAVAANPSSISHDPVSGNIYYKQTGTSNTGWILVGNVAGAASSTANALPRFSGTSGKIIKNSTLIADDNGFLSSSVSTAGATVGTQFTNSDNTSSGSNAWNRLNSGGTSGGIVAQTFSKGTARSYSLGMAATSSTDLLINTAAAADVAPTTGTILSRMNSSGQRNLPLQPAFLAFLGTTDTNISGNGLSYTLGGQNALTEVFDQGGNFVTTGTYTAPIDGRHQLSTGLYFAGITALMTFVAFNITTSNRAYTFGTLNIGVVRTIAAASDLYACACSVLADMDAGDTFIVNGSINGGAGNTASMSASSARVFMSGALIC